MAKAKSEQTKVADLMNGQADNGQADNGVDTDTMTEETTAITLVEGERLPQEWQFGAWQTVSSVIWRPEPGWALMGTYHGRAAFEEGDFDALCAVHTILDFKTSLPITFVGGTMLDKFIMDAKIGPGTRVIIRRLDMSETKKGRHVNNWDIKIDPSTINPDYKPPIDTAILASRASKRG